MNQNQSILYRPEYGLKLQVVQPAQGTPPYAALVWIHGGGWRSEDTWRMLPHIAWTAEQGAIGISVEYRLISNEQTTIWDCADDCITAMRYIRAHADELNIDLSRITLLGDSAGGHLALCAASPMMTGGEVLASAVIDFNGIVDLTMKWKKDLFKSDNNSSQEQWLKQYELARSISPVYNICSQNPPTMILNGLEDKVVEPEEAARYWHALQSKGVDAVLRLMPGVPHAFILFDYAMKQEEVYNILEVVREFLMERKLLPDNQLII